MNTDQLLFSEILSNKSCFNKAASLFHMMIPVFPESLLLRSRLLKRKRYQEVVRKSSPVYCVFPVAFDSLLRGFLHGGNTSGHPDKFWSYSTGNHAQVSRDNFL